MTRPSEDLLLPEGVMVRGEPDLMKEHLSTWLSSAAILAVAVGVGWGLWPHLGPWSLCIAGVALAALVGLADMFRSVEPKPEPEHAAPALHPLPGPADPGVVHISGHR